MPILSPESQAVRDATYDAGKTTGQVAQEARELQEAAMLAVCDELDYLSSKLGGNDATATALKQARAKAIIDYNLAAEKERSMVGNAMKHIHKDLSHLHGKHAALENANGGSTTGAAATTT